MIHLGRAILVSFLASMVFALRGGPPLEVAAVYCLTGLIYLLLVMLWDLIFESGKGSM